MEQFIGGHDRDHYHGDILYTPVIEPKYFTVQLENIFTNVPNTSPIITWEKTIIDSGTTVLLLPDPTYKDIIAQLSASCHTHMATHLLCGKKNLINSDPRYYMGFNDDELHERFPTIRFGINTHGRNGSH